MPFTIGPKIHNVIPRELKTLIKDFFSLADWEGLYLTGGTCLAEYYFGHRLSIDMDLFTQNKNLFEAGHRFFRDPKSFRKGHIQPIRETPYIHQYHYFPNTVEEPIKVDLVLDAVPHIASPHQIGKVWVDTLEDILSNKMGCLISRNEAKDYLDLFYLIPPSNLTTKEIIALGQIKDGGLDALILGNQIEFIFHAKTPEPKILGKTNWQALLLFFKKFQKECFDLVRPQ